MIRQSEKAKGNIPQLQTWLNDDEPANIEEESKEQLELRKDLENKPSDLKRCEET